MRSLFSARVPELDPDVYGFGCDDLENPIKEGSRVTLLQLIEHLRKIYCGGISVEFMHLRVGFWIFLIFQ